MKRPAFICLVYLLSSCRSYDTSAVAMHSGGYTVARSPTTGMVMGMPNTGRQQAEAQKAQAFYKLAQ